MVSSLSDKSEIINLVKHINLSSGNISYQRKKVYHLSRIVFAEDFITINYLASKLNVSRNTIVNDLDKVHWLINNQIHPSLFPVGLDIKGMKKPYAKQSSKSLRKPYH